jgi:hypothetical protein
MRAFQSYKKLSFPNNWLQHSIICVCRCFYLFLSGTITLKTIFNHFQNYIFKRYTCIKEYIEKPTILLFHQYPVAPLVLHLAQWRLANEAESLMMIQYATKPRNPE